MRSISALTLAASLVAGAPAAARTGLVQPTATPAGGQVVLADVQRQYSQMEQNIELQFAKLIQEARNNKEALEGKIKDIDRQKELLKQQLKKLDLALQKIQELLPKILESLGSDSGAGKGRTPSTVRRDQLAALLEVELRRAGIRLAPDELRKISDAILGNRFGKYADDQRKDIEDVISKLEKISAEVNQQKAAAKTQIEKVQQDREKTLAELRAQKLKAIKVKESDLPRAGSAPTPTRTPIMAKSGS